MKKFGAKEAVVLGVIILVIFIGTQPKLSAQLFPFKRQHMWREFVQKVERTQTIDGPTFWEFREFYYPGYFTYERNGFDNARTKEVAQLLNVELLPQAHASAFLIYKSDKVHSLEALVSNDEISNVLKDNVASKSRILVSDKSNSMYVDGKKARIIFIKPTTEMVKANGYFDYRDKDDKAIIQDKYWLNVTEIELD